MKKTIIGVIGVLVSVCVIAGVFAACKGADPKPQNSNQTISTDGSTSMEKVIGYLSESYMEENKNVTVTYNPTGSGLGIQAVAEGRCDIGLASRNLKDEEKENLNETVVAIDGIAVIVNNEKLLQI